MSDMYKKFAQEYANVAKTNIYNALYDKPSLLALVKSRKFDHCLDLGCGPGHYLGDLKSFCKKITAIDGSEEFIKMLSSEHPDVKSYACNLENGLKAEKDKTFDLIISGLFIHYIKDLKYLFNEVSRVLKPGGVFAFSTHHPNLDFEDSVSKNYFDTEYLTQTWNTIPGKALEVSFYRRPLTDIFNFLFEAGLVIDGFSEGSPSLEIKDISEKHYQRLSTKPHFLFVRARQNF